jgi:hypothetical protein
VWLPSLSGCAQRGAVVFKAVWRRTATSTLHDGLPGGIVLCNPQALGNKMISQKDELRVEVLFIAFRGYRH